MSRFLDLPEPSLGFLAKFVCPPLAGGGVTAGSLVSKPSDFLVKVVVAINMPTILKSACHCPDTNVTRAGGPQGLGARTGRRTGCENIVHQNHPFTVQPVSRVNHESPAHVRRALLPREQCLSGGRSDPPEQFRVQGDSGGGAEVRCQPFGLVEFTFPLLHRI